MFADAQTDVLPVLTDGLGQVVDLVRGMGPTAIGAGLMLLAIRMVPAMLLRLAANRGGWADPTSNGYRDNHWREGESFDAESGMYSGRRKNRNNGAVEVYSRRKGSRRRTFES